MGVAALEGKCREQKAGPMTSARAALCAEKFVFFHFSFAQVCDKLRIPQACENFLGPQVRWCKTNRAEVLFIPCLMRPSFQK